MTAGLSITNDAGSIQITESFIGFGLRHKSTVTLILDSGSHPNPLYVHTLTVTADSPILAISSTDLVAVRQSTNSSGNWSFLLMSNSAAVVTYYVFDKAQHAVGISDTFGLKVCKADGTLTFHTSMKPLRVVGVSQSSPTDGISSGSLEGVYVDTITLASGRNYAVANGTFCYRSEMYDSSEYYGDLPIDEKWMEIRTMISMSSVNSNTVDAGLIPYESYYNSMPDYTAELGVTHGAIMMLLIDVTGY